jgi:rubrerythrin
MHLSIWHFICLSIGGVIMDKNELIHGCIKAEKSAASIYKKLMKMFPEKKDFWKELFDDEINHLSFLNDVKSLGLTDAMEKIELPPSTAMINKTLKLADDLTAKITADSISFKKALAMALKLEESMVETYTNKIIANLISCKDESSYKKMVSDEKKHINKLNKMMK